MSLENTLKKQMTRLQKELDEIEKKMGEAPEGELSVYQGRKQTRWYELKKDDSGKTNRREIPRTDRSHAEKLAVKAYYQARISTIKKKLSLYENIMAALDVRDDPVEKLLQNPEIATLLRPYYKSEEEKYREWANADYIKSARHPEHLTVNSSHGLLRSKSEYIIFTELDKYGLTARYECQFIAAGVEIFPDFIIRHPVTGEIFIWEHLGLIDRPNYREEFKKKIDTYAAAGFHLGVNLIITTETDTHPLDVEYVDLMIEYYFKNMS
ncbi:MAG: hypothetical protein MJ059_03175 [Lachnospiraceae bacterium]|nr:hypothetical protein [Lachnospiraceae bacterium]